ncbi:MAG: polysaccharide deacetylase [Clostridiales bacterium]|nr:polysaccharide deacetylase [Clostridiales bacterium]
MIDHASTALHSNVPQVKGQITLRRVKPRYLGSVRFFKHLIVTFVSVMMILPWGVVAFMAGKEETRRTESRQLEAQLIVTMGELQSFVNEYEALLARIDSDDAENLMLVGQLMDQLEIAESLYEFESAYGHLHPELRVEGPKEYIDSSRTVYLTFDDGPGGYTKSVLDILQRYDVRATFFVVGYVINSPGREDLLRRMVEEGHTIGVHTFSHVYKDVYSSLEAYLEDFAKTSERIEEITGIKPDIFRFPGGSLNSYNERWGNTIISEMLNRGYRYYDWNAGSGDASTEATVDSIYEDVIRQVHGNPYSVVLMHDGGGGRQATVQALPMIIERLQREGYEFDKLTNQVRPTVYTTAGYNRG